MKEFTAQHDMVEGTLELLMEDSGKTTWSREELFNAGLKEKDIAFAVDNNMLKGDGTGYKLGEY